MNAPASQTFASEADYRAAIDATLAAARREIRVFDQDLVRMDLEDPIRIAPLTQFLSGDRDRCLRIVLHDTTHLERHSPRLIALFQRFAHAVQLRRTPDHLRELADCWLLADEIRGAIRFHASQARGKLVTDDRNEIHPWWQRFDELWEASVTCSIGTATGL